MNNELVGLLFLLMLTGGPNLPMSLPPAPPQPEAIVIARRLISDHEGLVLHPYKDTVGKVSIGYGRNLDDRGISRLEAEVLRESDLAEAYRIARRQARRFSQMNPARQAVLVDMAFNLGEPRLSGFKKMFAALERLDYATAAAEMRDSRWYGQVGRRGKRLVKIMETGEIE